MKQERYCEWLRTPCLKLGLYSVPPNGLLMCTNHAAIAMRKLGKPKTKRRIK
jgi:hypothetical protein